MSELLKDFKAFINRGNVVDLAVAVVLGAAFAAVVNSFVNDVLLQIIAAIFGEADFSRLTIDIGDGVIRYGAFLNSVISFVTIAFAVFLVVKVVTDMQRRNRKETADEAAEAPTADIALLTEIRDELRAQRSR